MSKYWLVFVLAMVLVAANPVLVGAESHPEQFNDTKGTITRIQAAINLLKEAVAKLVGSRKESPTPGATDKTLVFKEGRPYFTPSVLRLGATDLVTAGRVSELQRVIKETVNPEQPVTGYFGRITEQGVDALVKEIKDVRPKCYSDIPQGIPIDDRDVVGREAKIINCFYVPERSSEAPEIPKGVSVPITTKEFDTVKSAIDSTRLTMLDVLTSPSVAANIGTPPVANRGVKCKGDLNQDGAVNSFDIEGFKAVLEGKGSQSQVWYADLNDDGRINSKDVALLIDTLFGSLTLKCVAR